MGVTKTPPNDTRMVEIAAHRRRSMAYITDLDRRIAERARTLLNADYRWRKHEDLLVFEINDPHRSKQAEALRFAVAVRDLVPVSARRFYRGDGFILLGFITGTNKPKGNAYQ